MTTASISVLSTTSDELEQAAATLLGLLLFEFSRLDMNLGLCCVWIGGGQQLDELSKRANSLTFHKKLDFLRSVATDSNQLEAQGASAYCEWIDRAHALRGKRNQLVHGRWGFSATLRKVINVVGLPTSDEQQEFAYSLGELQAILDEFKQLQIDLNNLRNRWPL